MPETKLVDILPSVTAFTKRVRGSFIDGRYEDASLAGALAVEDPSTGSPILHLGEAPAVVVDRAVVAADRAFQDKRWRGLRPADRERILLMFADLVEANGEELAQLESWNQGKSINVTRAIDVGGSIEFMRYYAGLVTKIAGQAMDLSIVTPLARHHAGFTRREPVGVVGAIAPWNFPLMIGLWKIMPALASGCSIVLKPSEVTPLTTFRLAELAVEAGVPSGVFNVVHGTGRVTGAALVDHPLVRKISFTGSTATGREIGRAGVGAFKRISLELGGKNPAIVLADADLSKVVPGLLMGGLLNSGQVCAAISRIYVERSLYEPLRHELSGAIRAMPIGPGLDPAAEINPLVSAAHHAKVLGHIAAAEEAGLTIARGGDAPDTGYYVSPTLIFGASPGDAIQKGEVFGPVMSVTPVDSAEEAVRLSNDTSYGLASSLWTESLTTAYRVIPEIQAGTVWVNCHIPVDPHMPFGGYKESGIGRDFGPGALDAYLETKSVCIAH